MKIFSSLMLLVLLRGVGVAGTIYGSIQVGGRPVNNGTIEITLGDKKGLRVCRMYQKEKSSSRSLQPGGKQRVAARSYRGMRKRSKLNWSERNRRQPQWLVTWYVLHGRGEVNMESRSRLINLEDFLSRPRNHKKERKCAIIPPGRNAAFCPVRVPV